MPDPFPRDTGIEVFHEVIDILDAHSDKHFAIQGTALGAYRDQAFVPDEKDLDFGFMFEDFVHLVPDLASAFIKAKFELRVITTPFTQPRVMKVSKRGIPTDLTSYVSFKEGRRFCHNTLPKPKYAVVHALGVLDPPYMEVEFYERTLRIPGNIEEYLEREYGPEWRTPLDDSVSRTRSYDFKRKHKIKDDYLDQFVSSDEQAVDNSAAQATTGPGSEAS